MQMPEKDPPSQNSVGPPLVGWTIGKLLDTPYEGFGREPAEGRPQEHFLFRGRAARVLTDT